MTAQPKNRFVVCVVVVEFAVNRNQAYGNQALINSDIIYPMGSNKTSLLLVMTILMLRKGVKLDVIGIRSCMAPLL